MKLRVTKILGFLLFTLHSSEILAADAGGPKEASIGVEGAYHSNAQVWVPGRKDNETYTFSGASWLAYITTHQSAGKTGFLYSYLHWQFGASS